jgi:hypothetical protein
VCVCVCVRARARACACVCVWARARVLTLTCVASGCSHTRTVHLFIFRQAQFSVIKLMCIKLKICLHISSSFCALALARRVICQGHVLCYKSLWELAATWQ